MEECNEVTNQKEGSSELDTGDYFELILQNHDIDHEGSMHRSSPPLPPRKSPKSHCSLSVRTIGKPRALPPPASSAIENDSILRNCDHSNQTVIPPPLPAKTYDKKITPGGRQFVDKAVQCPTREEIVQDINGNASHWISTDNGNHHRIVQADGLLMVSTPANIILTQSNPVQTIVLAPQMGELNTGILPSTPRMIVLHSKATPSPSANREEESLDESRRNLQGGGNTTLGTSSRLVLESLAPSLTRSQSRGCANEYVGDPVISKKTLFKKHNQAKKTDSSGSLSRGDEASRKARGLVCQKCLKCKCNQCKTNSQSSQKRDFSQKTSQVDIEENCRKESAKELLVSLGDDGKIVTCSISEERFNEVRTENRVQPSCRRGASAFLLRCFSVVCCCSLRHNCWTRASDGCRCKEEANEDEDDEVFLSSNT